ncbi:hypothetical protein FA13DRAFT_104986 [Coprinellus micaceus]|uniref:Pali-domain-containing protein n=1 Tax=Coprinellus micaceus TaxID=71717 RepID=A0A4Y7THP0_COPMI|nr:hypothetical protein FA13DRAFT_104986 [Coprinellus micaceus]
MKLMQKIQFGIWAGCAWTLDNTKSCSPTGHGYIVQMFALDPKDKDIDTLTISAAWTRGLAAHPFATGSIFIALLASLSTRHTVNLFAPLLCGFAALMILITFAIQIALHLHVRVVIGRNVQGSVISAGPGFWITFVTLILVIAAGVLMFVKRRRQVLADAGYPMLSSQQKGTRGFLSLFRKS